MPTNDERREVAARLRDFESLRPVFKDSNICGFLEALGVGYMDWKGVCDRLADLIEPEPERTVNLSEAVDAICGEMCGDGWDWHNRAEAVVKTVAEMCGAHVKEEADA